MSTVFLSIIIPTYNEENRLGPTIEKIKQYQKKSSTSLEIIISDDGSIDDTLKIVQKKQKDIAYLSYLRNPHQGKGAAVKQGMLKAQGKYQLFMDADYSTPITEVNKFLKKIIHPKTDIVIGSRTHSQSTIIKAQPWYRELFGKSFNLMLRTLGLSQFTDTQCGFKLFTQKSSQNIFSKSKLTGATFDVEILLLAQKLGYNVQEESVIWENSADSRFTMSPKFFILVLKDLWYLYRTSKKNFLNTDG